MSISEATPTTAAASGTDRESLPWYERAMRWAQLTLVDDDTRPGSGYSTEFWLDYFRDIRADAACLSAGGFMAFYPTEVEGHYRSTNLGDTDPFGDLVKGSRELGLVVMARIDPHAVHDSVYRAHPEWVAVDRSGRPVPHWSAPGLWLTCPFSTYSTEFIPLVNAEIMTKYDVDAIFANRWTGSARCFCDSCRRQFREATGLEIPEEVDPASTITVLDEPEKIYRQWREDTLLAIAARWDEQIRALKPSARFIPNSGGGVLSDLDMSRLAAQVDTLFADKQARSGLSPAWTSGRHGKEFRAVMGGKPVGGIFSVGIEEDFRWKDSVQSAEEIRMWVASATANGMRAWFTKFGGTIPDARWLGVVGDIYRWHADNEKYLRNIRSLAEVGLVYSQQSARMYGPVHARHSVEEPLLGYYQALVESRIRFDLVHDQLLDARHLAGKKVLVLPNITSLSDEQCEQLRAFVENGGSLVASHETSLYDEDGRQRGDFGLADLFGVHYAGAVRRGVKNSYLELQPADDDPGHPLLAGITDTSRIINAVDYVEVVVDEGADARTPLTLIESYPDLPMEEVYRRNWSVGAPQLVARRHGDGRVLYFAGDLDRTFHRFFARDHYAVLVNAVRWALVGGGAGTAGDTDAVGAAADPIVVTGPGIVEVTAWRQAASLTVHVVNYNNPMYLKGPFHELQRSGPFTVSIRIPEGHSVTDVHLLNSAGPVLSRVEDGAVIVEIAAISDFEVVALDLDERQENTGE